MNSANSPRRRSRRLYILAAAAFISMAGCTIQVAPNDQPQQSAYAPPPASADAPADVSADPGLQELVAPIALYPDPILADVLPAASYPDQVQQAGQFIQSNPTPPDDQIAAQNWDPSVQALVHYPSILQYMAANPQWTESLGAAFVNQQPQVMEAIQDLAQAQAEGNLQTNQDEYVDDEGGFIYIRPAEDGVIFVPFYDPALVYREHSNIDYRYRYRDGAWLDHGVDWEHHDVVAGDWHHGWTGGPGGWHSNAAWGAQQQHWTHDDRRGPVHQVAPANYAKPPEFKGHSFQAVPARTASPAHRPVQTPPARQDEHLQNQPHSTQQPADRRDDKVHTPPPDNKPAAPHEVEKPQNPPHAAEAPKHVTPAPASPPPEQHARPMPPTKQAPPAKGKGPPPKPDGGN